MTSVLVAAGFLLMPAAVIYLAHHQRWAARIGVIVLCYFLGLVAGGAGILPEQSQAVPRVLSEISIVIALPLLLFTLDIRQWSRVAGKALLSMTLAATTVVTLATLLYFAYRDGPAGETVAANLAAMSVGVYTGGTPNLAAIKTGLEIPEAQYLAFHSIDALVGAVYFLFMMTLGVPLFRALLPGTMPRLSAGAEGGDEADAQQANYDHPDEDDYRPLLERANIGNAAAAVALSLVVVALSFGIMQVSAVATGGEANTAVLIIALTTLGILFSLHARVRSLFLSYRLGMYLIYVFCLAVSSLVSFEELANMDAVVAVFLLVIVFASLVVHALLCRLAKVDGDTFMVTSVAAVASPPFVPLIARALNNPGAMLPGMTMGVIGYALGSYLGISLGLYLRSL
ncbi:MAG: DUF819 family protein [Halioglobus sp.]